MRCIIIPHDILDKKPDIPLEAESSLLNPTSDKVNHLQPVPSTQRRFGPSRAWNDLPVMLNRNPVTLQPKFPNKLFKSGRLREHIEGAGLTVENQSE